MSEPGELHVVAPRTYFLTFAALLVLLVLTVAAAEIRHETLGIVIALLIATVKAGLIAMIFMHLWWSMPLVRAFAFAGLLWLAILFTLSWSDYITRLEYPGGVEAHVELPADEDRRH